MSEHIDIDALREEAEEAGWAEGAYVSMTSVVANGRVWRYHDGGDARGGCVARLACAALPLAEQCEAAEARVAELEAELQAIRTAISGEFRRCTQCGNETLQNTETDARGRKAPCGS